MAKQNSWLDEQFKVARTEIQSWSDSKQTAMRNALKFKEKEQENDGKATSVFSRVKETQT